VRWEIAEAVPGEGEIEQDLGLRRCGGPSAEGRYERIRVRWEMAEAVPGKGETER
jgi:hypothetical protein